MRRIYFYSFITIALLCAACAKNATTEESFAPLSPTQISENIAKADELARSRKDLDKIRQAVKLLAASRNFDDPNFETEWKFAKYNYFLGKLTDDKAESEKAFTNGENAGKIALRIAPDKPDGYFWYGANLGEQAKRAPLTKGLRSLDDIRAAMHKVIEIDKNYQSASAFDALGQLELETRLSGGSAEKAVEFLEKGFELNKENAYIRLHLAQAYLALKQSAKAKEQLEYILKMKSNPDYLPEYEEAVKESKKLLETRF